MRDDGWDYELLLEITAADDSNNSYALLRAGNQYGIGNYNHDSSYSEVTWKDSPEGMLTYIEENLEDGCGNHIEKNFIRSVKGKLQMMSYKQ
ncbi:hypothetical protein [Halanaerobaculum tunisiense]